MGKAAIIFGGSGFVGCHLIRYLVKHQFYDEVVVGDLVPPPFENELIKYIPTDIRRPIDTKRYKAIVNGKETHIYNLAAICRIPGYPDKDYFETNIRGAEAVCSFADEIGCQTIVFTSSISIYGTSEEEKSENSLPQPDNPYGVSKLIAEYIHRNWHAGDVTKNLHILRPGIIFGLDENANFTRLYKAIAGRYFLYPGRRNTRKASIYVKDVIEICYYFVASMHGLTVYDLTYPAAHTIEEICIAIANVTGKSRPKITIPAWLLLLIANGFHAIASLVGKRDTRFHPDRIRKLMISTNISGEKLKQSGCELRFGLEDSLRDWLKDNDGKGLY